MHSACNPQAPSLVWQRAILDWLLDCRRVRAECAELGVAVCSPTLVAWLARCACIAQVKCMYQGWCGWYSVRQAWCGNVQSYIGCLAGSVCMNCSSNLHVSSLVWQCAILPWLLCCRCVRAVRAKLGVAACSPTLAAWLPVCACCVRQAWRGSVQSYIGCLAGSLCMHCISNLHVSSLVRVVQSARSLVWQCAVLHWLPGWQRVHALRK